MLHRSDGIKLHTGINGLGNGVKRVMGGESMFRNKYTNATKGPASIARQKFFLWICRVQVHLAFNLASCSWQTSNQRAAIWSQGFGGIMNHPFPTLRSRREIYSKL
jgi:hypothetical protein